MPSIPAEDIMGTQPSPQEGYEYASPEDEQLLDSVMDTVEQIIHGSQRENMVGMIEAGPDLWQSVPRIVHMITHGVAVKMEEQQIPDDGMFFAQNGVVQQTFEMVWELADAIGHPAAQDDEQFQAAYMHTLKLLGDDMMDDTESAKEAQAFLIDTEYGPGTVDNAAGELEQELMASGGMI